MAWLRGRPRKMEICYIIIYTSSVGYFENPFLLQPALVALSETLISLYNIDFKWK